MKITSIECYLGYAITVKVNTDEGISGFGEAGLMYGNCREAAFGQCQDFASLVIGMDPFNTEEIWEHLHRHTFWGMNGGVVVTSAMAAIDTACWDIKGKALGLPVYKLLGGKTNKKLRAYASQLQFGWKKMVKQNGGLGLLYDPKEYYDVVKEVMDDGYDSVKIDPVFVPYKKGAPSTIFGAQGTHHRGSIRQQDLQLAVDRIAAAREAGGPDLDIIVEIHSLLDANTASELGRALEPYRIMYYEEPTMPSNPDMFKYIKERCSLPLATGERSYTRWGFRQFFEDRSLEIVQPDLCNTGGITETKKICDMAQVYDMGVQVHVCGGPIATAAALHVEATIPNFCIHEEHNANLTVPCIAAGKYHLHPVNGYYDIPEIPGIGQEMSESEMATSKKVVVDGPKQGPAMIK
ncbi:MAG: mandelate racemase/muconate lactonizing enzyme family protein [Sphaerochaetaceae bacterium]|nr:mandelate racemase/muconate lactonizing enzyme family protein [Sphaerochaetaceae bacterium]MDC7249631.1 mandelate racemase/muconate lactonizing enzyme family protein [Sphaerochaetaceae bacterium]